MNPKTTPMTGTLAQLVSLTSFGNEYLINGNLTENFHQENSTLKFCKSVEFVTFSTNAGTAKAEEVAYAADPVEWFKALKNAGCKRLALFYQPSANQDMTPDHKMAGFVGGGGTWLIEAVYGGHSDFWISKWEVVDRESPEQKIWGVKYGNIYPGHPTVDLKFDLAQVDQEMRDVLTDVAAFANNHDLGDWAQAFERANRTLDDSDPVKDFYHKDLIVSKNYSLKAQQLLYGAGFAWVFGGMGSWNDLGFETEEDNKTYDALSAALYNSVNRAVIAAVNS